LVLLFSSHFIETQDSLKGIFNDAGREDGMTGKEFLNALANGKLDLLQIVLDILDETGSDHALIGGLAVNAYAEPVVSPLI
jgi:hypothetical protein